MRSTILFEQNNQNKLYLTALGHLYSLLKEKSVKNEAIGLANNSIKKCKGCFGCWTKTPGECVIRDYGNDIAKEVINSDYCIILTSIRFGSYSSTIKQAVDRFIPLISPLFRFIDGETHHKVRYDKYPRLIPIGILNSYNKREEELFKRIIMRNRINLFTPQENQIVISDKDAGETIKEKITNIFN